MFANGPGDLGSIPGLVIPKTQKMLLDAALLNTHKGKVEHSWEWSSTLSYTSVEKLLKRKSLSDPRLRLPTSTIYI